MCCRCSLKSKCQGSDTPKRWLPYRGEECTKITSVMPHEIQRDKVRLVSAWCCRIDAARDKYISCALTPEELLWDYYLSLREPERQSQTGEYIVLWDRRRQRKSDWYSVRLLPKCKRYRQSYCELTALSCRRARRTSSGWWVQELPDRCRRRESDWLCAHSRSVNDTDKVTVSILLSGKKDKVRLAVTTVEL